MISATGNKYGEKVEVIFENQKFFFNGKENKILEQDMRYEMEKYHPIAGTYYTENVDDILNIAEVLRAWFFDEPNVEVTIRNEEYEEMPHENVVY